MCQYESPHQRSGGGIALVLVLLALVTVLVVLACRPYTLADVDREALRAAARANGEDNIDMPGRSAEHRCR